ncbi:MAG: glycosyltransferase, partial [Acidimicrobiia bacterium]|nr:glycosyltransferase [Acidimicrobiia bacterium]
MTRTNIGGPSVMLVDLLTGLDPLEFNQVVVRGTPHNDEGDFFAGRDLQAEVITLGALRRRIGGLSELRSLFDLVRMLRRLQPDIVHTHMAKAGVLGRLAAILSRVPIRVGRLTAIKRPDRFLALAATRTDAHFVFVGDGPLRDAVANQARALPNVTLVGWQEDLSVVYGALDVVVLTSD